jgi:hypothetical protein
MNYSEEITTATLETQHNKVTIEHNGVDLPFWDMMDLVIFPLLLGIGYSQKQIDEYLNKN